MSFDFDMELGIFKVLVRFLWEVLKRIILRLDVFIVFLLFFGLFDGKIVLICFFGKVFGFVFLGSFEMMYVDNIIIYIMKFFLGFLIVII